MFLVARTNTPRERHKPVFPVTICETLPDAIDACDLINERVTVGKAVVFSMPTAHGYFNGMLPDIVYPDKQAREQMP